MFRPDPRLTDRIAFAVLLSLPCAMAFRPLMAGSIPDFMDPVMYFFPLRWHAAHLVHEGQLPWWSRSILTGFPLFSNPQSALAYPTTVLMLAWPSGLTYTLPLLLHLGLFGSATYALLRRVGAGLPASLLAGGLCLAGSYGWTLLQLGNYMNILPWWPLWLLAMLGFLCSSRSPALTGGALAVAMMILGGAHQLALYGALGLGLLALPLSLSGERRGRVVGFILATAVFGLLIAAPGWLPQVAFLQETSRAAVLDRDAVLVGTLASPLDGIRQLAGGSSDAGASLSIGAFALLAAGALPPSGVRRRLWIGAWLGIVTSFLLAWKPVAGLVVDLVPGFGAFHDPKRILGVTQWLLIVAAGLGADGWIEATGETTGRRLLRLTPVLGPGIALAVAQWDVPLSASDAAIPIAVVFYLVFLTLPRSARGSSGTYSPARAWVAAPFILAALLLLAWDTARHVPFNWRTGSALAGDGPPELLGKAGLEPGERFFAVDWKRDFSYDFRRPDLRESALPNLAMLWNLEDIGGYEPARTPRYNRWLASAAPWPGGRQPWSGHFGLPFPPAEASAELEKFGEANPVAFLAPRWGIPVYLMPIGENRLGGWAPDWSADVTASLLYRPDPRARSARRLSVVDILGTRHPLAFDAVDSLPAMTPLIEVGGGERRNSALELDTNLRVQPLDLRKSGALAPMAGIELDLPPEEQPAWVFLWSERLQEVYSAKETGGLRLLTGFEAPAQWAVLRTPEDKETPKGRVFAHSIEANRLALEVEWNGSGPAVVEIHDAWWPGWRAWVNGAATEVRPSGPGGDGLWRWIEVPQGKSSVVLTYEPPGLRISLTLCAGGLLLLLLSGWLLDRQKPEGESLP